jgi:hypothetical protein
MGKNTTGNFIDDVLDVVVGVEEEDFPKHGTIKLIVPVNCSSVTLASLIVLGRL